MAKTGPSVRSRIEAFLNPQAGLLAGLALLFGLFASVSQLWQIVNLERPHLLRPDQVLLVPAEYPSGNVFLRLAGKMSYVSTGPSSKSVIITKEMVKCALGNRRFTEHWQSFENFAAKGCEIIPAESEDVRPIVLVGGNAVSHVTYFAPRDRRADRYADFYSWDRFTSEISRVGKLDMTFEAEVLGGRTLVQHCMVIVTPDDLANIRQRCAVSLPCS